MELGSQPRPRRARTLAAMALSLASLVWLSASACRTLSANLPANRRSAQIVDQFAQAFWNSNDDASLDRLMASRLKMMMRTSMLRGMREGLINEQGRVRSIGKAWYEDSIRPYRRFRVPIEFSRTIVDMRVSVDEYDNVANFFIADHIPPP